MTRLSRDELGRRVATKLAAAPNPALDAMLMATRVGELRRIGALMRLRIEREERGMPFSVEAETCSAKEFVSRYVRQKTIKDLFGERIALRT